MRRRDLGLLVLIVAAGALLRLPALSHLPSPNGDEGHWLRYARSVAHGEALALDPVHRGSSPAFAYVLGPALRLGGDPFLVVRLPGVVGLLLGCALCCLWLARAGAPRAGLTVAGVLALHPWSVLWSRTASVPYALALALMSAAAVAFVVGLWQRSQRHVAAAVLALALAAHFSPLAIVLVPPCVVLSLRREQRWVWRAPGAWLAGLGALLLLSPLASSMRSLPAPEHDEVLQGTLARLASMVATIVPSLFGESTVRHFTNHALPVWPAVAIGAGLALWIVLGCTQREVRQAGPLAGFGLVALGSAALLLPCVLAPARLWYLPTIDTERYAFVLLPGLALALGALAEARSRAWQAWLVAGVGVLLLAGSLRALLPLALGHGVARGVIVLEGGECYRGWLTTRDRRPPIALVAEVARRLDAAAVLYDGYPLQPMEGSVPGLPEVYAKLADERRYRGVEGRVLFVLWADGVQDRAAYPRAAAQSRARRKRLRGPGFSGATLERRVLQPDGAPLLEIWSALHTPAR